MLQFFRKAESGLKKVSDFETGAGVIHDVMTKHSIAYGKPTGKINSQITTNQLFYGLHYFETD